MKYSLVLVFLSSFFFFLGLCRQQIQSYNKRKIFVDSGFTVAPIRLVKIMGKRNKIIVSSERFGFRLSI